jgi:ferric-dicitrate binding protein FerR (iron transport regulator)
MTEDGIGDEGKIGEEQDTVARLLRLAGPRPEVSEERARRVKAAVRLRWQGELQTRRRRSRWWFGALAAAAGFLVALGLAMQRARIPTPPGPALPVAFVDVVAGTGGLIAPARGGTLRVAAGDPVPARSSVSTGADGRIALRLADGISIRMDHATRLGIESARDVVLERGAVYVDKAPGGTPFQVRTGLGVLRDIGTQFEARVGDGVLRLRVREGVVILDRDAGAETAEAGIELTAEAGRRALRRQIAVDGLGWGWTATVAPAFAIEGRRLPEFLRWASRETGWRLRFESAEVEESMRDVVLHGSVRGLGPEEALATVLPTCGLAFRIQEGTLHVNRADAGGPRR